MKRLEGFQEKKKKKNGFKMFTNKSNWYFKNVCFGKK